MQQNFCDFRAVKHTDHGVHLNFELREGRIESRWFDSVSKAESDFRDHHSPPFDDVLAALREHLIWTGLQDSKNKYLALFYARVGGRGMDGKDYGHELTPQERYDQFNSTLDQAKAEHDAKQDKELQHPSKRQKSVIDVESSEWKVQSAIVSWFRGYIEIKKPTWR